MYRHILVPLDGSDLAEQVLPHATAVAQRGETRLTLLRAVARELPHVNQGLPRQPLVDPMPEILAEVERYLQRVSWRLRAEGYNVETVVSTAPPAQAIVDYAEQQGVDLIAIASHGRNSVGRLVFGSVAERVLHSSQLPLLIVRPR